MHPAFQAMTNSLLTVLGQEALLRGDVPCRVSIQFGVQTVGSDDNVVAEKTVATVDSVHDPRPGDTLVHPDGNFIIDAPLRRNGYSDRWIVRAA